MRTLACCLFILIVSGCSDPAVVSPSPADGTVTLSSVSFAGSEAILRLTNNTDESISYLGFGATSPLKRVEYLSDSGWVLFVWDWCGTGAEIFSVAARTSVTISAPVFHRGLKHRVLFGVTAGASEEYRTITSNEFIVP